MNQQNKNAKRKTPAQIERRRRRRAALRKRSGEPAGGIDVEPVLVTRNARVARQYRVGMRDIAMSPVSAHLSECAKKFCAARTDPWSSMADGACIPDMIVLASQKLRFRSRGFFATGFGTVGWITLDPFAMLWNDGVPNPLAPFGGTGQPIVYTTGNSFAPSDYEWAGSASAYVPIGVAGSNSDSTFTSAFLTNPGGAGSKIEPPTFRLVGAGIRVRYTGAAINRGGRITAYRSPDNSEIDHVSGLTSSRLLQTKEAITDIVSSDWHHVCYVPTQTVFVSYNPVVSVGSSPSFGTGTPINNANHHCMLLYIDAPSSVPLQFEFDVQAHFEVMGTQFVTTPSHADPVGMAAVQTALTQTPITGKIASVDFRSTLDRALGALTYSASGVAYSAGRALGRAAMTAAAGVFSNFDGGVDRAVGRIGNGPVVEALDD